jgi:hypothetical protein
MPSSLSWPRLAGALVAAMVIEFGAVGARINWKVLEAAVVYAKQNNGDLARVPLAGNFEQAIAFDADGVEALLRFNVPRFSVYGGYIYYRPDTVDPLLDPDFNTKYRIAGLTVGIMPNMYAYVESRVFNDSVDAQGQEGFDVLAIGVHYGFHRQGVSSPIEGPSSTTGSI